MSSTGTPAVRSVESLGKVIYETKPNVSNLIAGVILGVLFIAGGLSLSGYLIRQMFLAGGDRPQGAGGWLGAIALMFMGVGLAGAGVMLFVWVRSMVGFRLSVCADGFYLRRGGATTVFAWSEIRQVRETVLHEKLPLVKGPARRVMPTKTSRSYVVVRCDGEEFSFDENVIPRTSLLAGPLAAAAKNHGFAWESSEESS